MTDAREIIARAIRDRHEKSSNYDVAAHAVTSIEALGFRIIGKDEVDPVTVEKCAEVTEMYVSMGWRGTEITESIRAIGSAS